MRGWVVIGALLSLGCGTSMLGAKTRGWVVVETADLRVMNRTDFYASDPRTKATHYAAAWALVHLLKMGDLSLSPPFIRYLEALHEGTRESVAWSNSFEALNLPERYQSYLSEHHFARVRSIGVAEPDGLVAQPMSRGEAALMLAQLETWNDEKGAKRAEAYIDFAGEQDSTRLAATLLRGAFLKARGDEARDHLEERVQAVRTWLARSEAASQAR